MFTVVIVLTVLQWIYGKKGSIFQRHHCVAKSESAEIWCCLEAWTRIRKTWYDYQCCFWTYACARCCSNLLLSLFLLSKLSLNNVPVLACLLSHQTWVAQCSSYTNIILKYRSCETCCEWIYLTRVYRKTAWSLSQTVTSSQHWASAKNTWCLLVFFFYFNACA